VLGNAPISLYSVLLFLTVFITILVVLLSCLTILSVSFLCRILLSFSFDGSCGSSVREVDEHIIDVLVSLPIPTLSRLLMKSQLLEETLALFVSFLKNSLDKVALRLSLSTQVHCCTDQR